MSLPTKEELLSRKKHLENIKEILKSEFIGINNIIDEVVDSISSWYLIPSMQKRPLVINLWGMTGVGKTALVMRLAELIDFNDLFYHFDIGESNSWELKAKHEFKKLRTKISGNPFLCCFDDFQFARTKTPDGRELDKPNTRFIWELMDSGTFNVDTDNIYLATHFKNLIDDLKLSLEKGVVVENGKVTQNIDCYIESMSVSHNNPFARRIKLDHHAEQPYFIPETTYGSIRNLAMQSIKSGLQLEKKFLELNGAKSIQILEKIYNKAFSQEKVDCTQALIFIIGNLDEAFSMSGDINPDLSADRFHENSLKINVSNAKQTLQSYFRQEQVARLGNNHIIYPAISEENYQKIIDMELQKISDELIDEVGIPIRFQDSVHQLLYKEGVYPTLGTRPLFSTINSYVRSKMGLIIGEVVAQDTAIDVISTKHENNSLIFEFFNGDSKLVCTQKFSSTGRLSKLREPRQDDEQAINAVHESGHVILSVFLMHSVPIMACSTSANGDSRGLTHMSFNSDIISKEEMMRRAALGLGGYLAEKLIFGKDHVHSGSDDDLRKVTNMVSKMIKSHGMGSDLLSVNIADPRTNYHYHDEGQFNKQVREVIKEAKILALKTFNSKMEKLLLLADYLSDEPKIGKEEIIELLDIGELQNNEGQFRKQLKRQAKKMTTKKKNVA
jgi:cell division protease FtsH